MIALPVVFPSTYKAFSWPHVLSMKRVEHFNGLGEIYGGRDLLFDKVNNEKPHVPMTYIFARTHIYISMDPLSFTGIYMHKSKSGVQWRATYKGKHINLMYKFYTISWFI